MTRGYDCPWRSLKQKNCLGGFRASFEWWAQYCHQDLPLICSKKNPSCPHDDHLWCSSCIIAACFSKLSYAWDRELLVIERVVCLLFWLCSLPGDSTACMLQVFEQVLLLNWSTSKFTYRNPFIFLWSENKKLLHIRYTYVFNFALIQNT